MHKAKHHWGRYICSSEDLIAQNQLEEANEEKDEQEYIPALEDASALEALFYDIVKLS